MATPVPRPLTLCFVADAGNIHVQRWLGYFIRQGHRVTCLSDKPGDIAGATVLPLPNRDSLLAAGARAGKTAVLVARSREIRAHLSDLRPDVVHAIFLYQRGWSAALAGGHPLIITLLGSDVYLNPAHYRSRLHLWRDRQLNRLALRRADAVTTVSQDLFRAAVRLRGSEKGVSLVPIGTDPALFAPRAQSDPAVADLRDRLAIPPGAFVILSPRQMTPLYNLEVIIDSIPAVLDAVPNAVFLLKDTFCDTPQRQAYVETLKARVDALGVAHAVRWAEQVPFEELPLFYALAGCVVSIPATDGMPVTLFEAMACRVPVIVGDLPAYDRVIVHEQSGLRVAPSHPAMLAEAIARLALSPGLRDALISGGARTVEAFGLFDVQMARIEALYQQLAAGSASGAPQAVASWAPLDRLLLGGLLKT